MMFSADISGSSFMLFLLIDQHVLDYRSVAIEHKLN
jgi:hypothetical protein